MYYKYNDNELIYLIKEGNASAFDMIYQKYYPLMVKVLFDYKVNPYVFDDVLQEARMKLIDAIRFYDSSIKCTFYKYYILILTRMLMDFYKKNKFDLRFKNTCVLKESENYISPKSEFIEQVMQLTKMLDLDDEFSKRIFDECIIEGFSLVGFCTKYDYDYRKVRYKYQVLINEIKKILTNS